MKSNRFLKILYSKRDDFPFPIVRIPYLRINVPSKITYSAFGTNILKQLELKVHVINLGVLLNFCLIAQN